MPRDWHTVTSYTRLLIRANILQVIVIIFAALKARTLKTLTRGGLSSSSNNFNTLINTPFKARTPRLAKSL